MHYRTTAAMALASLGVALSGAAFGQQTTTGAGGWRMPYERGFWGYAGASVGQSKLHSDCVSGFSCDDKDTAYRIFGGGRFNNIFGLEAGLLDMGRFDRGGGRTKGWGLDLALVAGVPLGENSSVFGKLGTVYARTDVSADPAAAAAGMATGKDHGWGERYGIGGQLGLTPNWALRADLDRYRMPFVGGKKDVDTFMIGAQYTFR